jgi:hypothetical protein
MVKFCKLCVKDEKADMTLSLSDCMDPLTSIANTKSMFGADVKHRPPLSVDRPEPSSGFLVVVVVVIAVVEVVVVVGDGGHFCVADGTHFPVVPGCLFPLLELFPPEKLALLQASAAVHKSPIHAEIFKIERRMVPYGLICSRQAVIGLSDKIL